MGYNIPADHHGPLPREEKFNNREHFTSTIEHDPLCHEDRRRYGASFELAGKRVDPVHVILFADGHYEIREHGESKRAQQRKL